MKVLIYILNALLLAALVGCNVNNADEPLPAEEPDIIGKITDIQEGEYSYGILVEEDTAVQEPSEPGGTKIIFAVNNQTYIFIQQQDGELNELNVEDLEIGQEVKGWARGVLTLSHPRQGLAKHIVVVEK